MVDSSFKKGIVCASLFGSLALFLLIVLAPEHPVFWFLILLWGIAFFLPLYLKKGDLLELWIPFVAYLFVLFPVRAVFEVLRGQGKFIDLQSSFGYMTLSLFFALLGLLSFYWGYFQPSGKRIASRLPSLPERFSRKRLVHVSGLLLFIGLFSCYLLFKSLGAFEILSFQGGEFSLHAFTGKYYILWGIDFLTLLFLFLYASQDSRIPKVFILLSFLLAMAIGIALGAKETIIQPIFYLVVIRHYTRKRLSFPGIFAYTSLILLLLLIYPFLKSFGTRGFHEFFLFAKTGTLWKELPSYLLSRFYGIDSLTLVVQNVPSAFPYKFGETFFQLFIQPIPRFLWAEKPLSVGFQFTEAFTHQYYGFETSSALTLAGEFFLNFGLPGILGGFAVFGILGRIAYEYLGKRQGGSYVILYALTLYAIVMLNEGNISGRLPFYITKIIPTFLAILYIKPMVERKG